MSATPFNSGGSIVRRSRRKTVAEATFRVTHAGPHVTIQDGGRFGLMRFGVPASGPMDRGAFAIANAALGNPLGHPGIEISQGGLNLECVSGCVTMGIAGGGFVVETPTTRAPSWLVLTIQPGERLTIRPGLWGSWTYVTFAGHLQAQAWLGSRATHGPSGFGGGRLKTGDSVVIGSATSRPDLLGPLPLPVSARPRQDVRVVLGPQDRFFDAESIATLLSYPFALTDAYDRMGVRLSGPALTPHGPLDMPSEAIMRGSVQVNGDGVATVLLADHQTTGGYPKIATLLADDLDGFVQLRSRDRVMFRAVSPQAAIAATRTRAAAQARFLAAMTTRRRS
jgi:allophanate hydrolase